MLRKKLALLALLSYLTYPCPAFLAFSTAAFPAMAMLLNGPELCNLYPPIMYDWLMSAMHVMHVDLHL